MQLVFSALTRCAHALVAGGALALIAVPAQGRSEAQVAAQATTRGAAADGRNTPGGVTCPPQAAAPTPAQLQHAQRNAQDRGFLWRLSKGGRTSYLYGTLHVGKVAWVYPGPQLRKALAASDTVALELDPTDPKIQQAVARAATGSSRALPAATRQRLAAQRDAACLPASAFDRLHPVMQLMALSMVAAKREGLDAAFGSEPLLAGHAKAAGQSVVSLETPQLQMQALMPANKADDEAALVNAGLDQLEADSMRPVLRRMIQAWQSGNVDDFENYGTWCDCMATAVERDLYRRINDERNPGMAASIDALHQRGLKVFAAVGALHMTGPAGLPKLMARRGFQVERVPLAAR